MRPRRRILSLWFPRLGAERILRQDRMDPLLPFAVVATQGAAQMLHSLSVGASAMGLAWACWNASLAFSASSRRCCSISAASSRR